MNLKDILAISGKSGLYKFVAKGRNGIIVESLSDKTRQAIPMSHNASALADIAIYTDNGEMPLHEVFTKLKAHDETAKKIDLKNDPDAVRKLFALVAPQYTEHRVYLHDMQKAIRWYNTLTEIGMTDFTPPEAPGEEKE